MRAHLPIAHALRLPEPTKKNKSESGQRTGAKQRDTEKIKFENKYFVEMLSQFFYIIDEIEIEIEIIFLLGGVPPIIFFG